MPRLLVLPFPLALLLGVGVARVLELCLPVSRASAVFLVGAVVAFRQHLGIPLFGRIFDQLDLLMYATGANAALAFERLAFSALPQGSRAF